MTENNALNIVAIIPARMGSSRFPGKPMAEIAGTPMIGHVFQRVAKSSLLSGVYVATCDTVIEEYIHSIGGQAIMTSDSHERCSDRCAEAMLKIESETGKKIDIVVMVQGDEPMVHPDMIDEAVRPMIQDPEIPVINLVSDISDEAEFEDPNEVKVVCDLSGNALYFSREAIPSRKKGASRVPMLKQVCIIPFQRDFLLRFNELEPTPLEIIESVDMMRCLEHGYPVKMIPTNHPMKSVDTPEDLADVLEAWKTLEVLQ